MTLCKMCQKVEIEVKPKTEEMGNICPQCQEGMLEFLGELYVKSDAGKSTFQAYDNVYDFTEKGKKMLWDRLKKGQYHANKTE